MGGENPAFAAKSPRWAGSSPRGRGKHHHLADGLQGRRLIPAWAGKTGRSAARPPGRWAHPRVGGENSVKSVVAKPINGSSPRGRGKLEGVGHEVSRIRLIPAWAGKTGVWYSDSWNLPAHPRVGGENSLKLNERRDLTGSSPRGRGKLNLETAAEETAGLIPAWAGKTLSDLRFYRADRSDLGNP